MRNRLILLGAIFAIVAVAYYGDLFQYLAPDRLRELLTDAGAWGPILVVTLFTFLQPFFMPGAIFMVAAAGVWPFWMAFPINWVGSIGAGMFGFAFARYLGRDWVEHRMPERLRKWDERLSERGLKVVILFRLIFFLNPASHWALGLSRVSIPNAILGTAISFAPWALVWSYYGNRIFIWIEEQTASTWIGLALVIVAIIAFRRYRSRAAAVDAA
jgi:uncharacterized membrane protein YdjX (TVP38/TMEM64 family)